MLYVPRRIHRTTVTPRRDKSHGLLMIREWFFYTQTRTSRHAQKSRRVAGVDHGSWGQRGWRSSNSFRPSAKGGRRGGPVAAHSARRCCCAQCIRPVFPLCCGRPLGSVSTAIYRHFTGLPRARGLGRGNGANGHHCIVCSSNLVVSLELMEGICGWQVTAEGPRAVRSFEPSSQF